MGDRPRTPATGPPGGCRARTKSQPGCIPTAEVLVIGLGRCVVAKQLVAVRRRSPTPPHLLELFLEHPRQVLTRSQIFERVWGYDFGATSNALGVYMGYLRRKTEEGGEPRLLHTVRGIGYVLRD